MAADTSGTSKFRITVIPADEDGCRFYLEQYKPFRLASLQQDAHAFGSTYAREIKFDDEAWLGRIRNPSATTFVAVQSHDNRVVASTSLIGPLPNDKPTSNPYHVVSGVMAESGTAHNNKNSNASGEDIEPLHFQMSAVYTSPEARGQGLAKSLIRAATEEACSRARGEGRPLALSVVVYAANSAAISVYERCGFARSAEEPKLVFNVFKNSSEEELNMYFQGDS
ncbi:hypothetical protein GQX73_g9692 [Xylaria multiplex]|uniref:N-acetyltransferase domain-containing protein n=1 Tax=Xylaria multiplex TaxID=323545 RepID=A0A7C8IHW1_9PEZI|nr:hypothetical protein GQX73_g9692 [Xylaria multiplex]